MTEEERNLSTLMHELVPDPASQISYDSVRRGARQRRTGFVAAAASAVAVAIAVPAVALHWNRPDDGRALLHGNPQIEAPSGIASAAPSCPETRKLHGQAIMVDYIDFLQLGGRQYVASLNPGVTARHNELLTTVARVNCTISDLTEDGTVEVVGPFNDGNAAYLPLGTAIRAVRGYDAACRVAAELDGRVRVYLAQHEVAHHSRPMPCALKAGTSPSPGIRMAIRTHCGVLSATIGGRLWLAHPPLSDGSDNPPPGWDENQTRGDFVITSPGQAEFRSDGGQTATFRLAPAGTADPAANCE
jgi:hypothetical protein